MRLVAVVLFVLSPLFAMSQDSTAVTHGTIKIKKKYVRADYWPRIADKFHGEITRAELCHPKGIYTVYPMRILSFEMKCPYLRDSVKLISKSHKLTEDMCKIVTVLPSGSMVHFENIKAVDDKGQAVRLNSLRYSIVGSPKKD